MPVPPPVETVPELLEEIAAFPFPSSGQTRALPIDLAREVIAASEGTVTWGTSGTAWATLCKADPATVYPPL